MYSNTQLIGNLGKNPEVRYTADQKIVVNASLATTDYHSKQTEWHNLVFFGRNAEIARDYLKKGSRIFIDQGRISTRSYKHKIHRIDIYVTEIIVGSFKMLDKSSPSPSNHNKEPFPEGFDYDD